MSASHDAQQIDQANATGCTAVVFIHGDIKNPDRDSLLIISGE